MSLDWQDSTSPARVKALAAAEASGEFDHTVPTWDIYCDLRNSVIWALLITGFPARSEWAITEKNWTEVYCRLQILETVLGCQRRYNNGADNPTRDMYFTPEEIKSLVGLRVNVGNKSHAEFRNEMFERLETTAKSKLDNFINPLESRAEDPYYWEKLFAPDHVKEESK